MIRLIVPSIEEDDLLAVRQVLETGFLVQGAQVAAFEQMVADYVGCRYAVAVSNCTAALHLSLLALNIKPGDIVVVTAYSWPATANVIELCGGQPVFVDICPDTFNLDPSCLEITLKQLFKTPETANRVKAILPVHTFGQMADLLTIIELADRYNLPVIEDAACALGASLYERQAGTWGKLSCFSFHPRKAITTGEGGMVTTNDPILAKKIRALRNHGLDPDAPTPDFIMPGFNYRMTEFQAALGQMQMAKLDRIIATRQLLAQHYDELLSGSPVISPCLASGVEPVYQSYVVLLPEIAAPHRAQIIDQLKVLGIETTIGTWHMPMITHIRERYGYHAGQFPMADLVFARSLTLPMYEGLKRDQQAEVITSLLSTLKTFI